MNEPNAPPKPEANEIASADGAQTVADGGTAVLEDLEALRAKAEERDQFLSLLKRTQADFENYQKRNQREREQERRFADAPLAIDLLPPLEKHRQAPAPAPPPRQTVPPGPEGSRVDRQLPHFIPPP